MLFLKTFKDAKFVADVVDCHDYYYYYYYYYYYRPEPETDFRGRKPEVKERVGAAAAAERLMGGAALPEWLRDQPPDHDQMMTLTDLNRLSQLKQHEHTLNNMHQYTFADNPQRMYTTFCQQSYTDRPSIF